MTSVSKKRSGPPTRDTSKEPYVDNYPELAQWLDKVDATCQWQERVGGTEDDDGRARGGMMIEGWIIPKLGVVIVQVWSNGNGWHLYTESKKTMTTGYLAETEAALRA